MLCFIRNDSQIHGTFILQETSLLHGFQFCTSSKFFTGSHLHGGSILYEASFLHDLTLLNYA